MTVLKSYRTRLNTLSSQLDFQPDPLSKAAELINEKYDVCLATDSLAQIESLLDEVRFRCHIHPRSSHNFIQLEHRSREQEARINVLVGTLEKLYTKLADACTSPVKRSAAYILRENNADTLKQVSGNRSDNTEHITTRHRSSRVKSHSCKPNAWQPVKSIARVCARKSTNSTNDARLELPNGILLISVGQ